MRVEYEGNRVKQVKYGEPSTEDYAIEDYTYDEQHA